MTTTVNAVTTAAITSSTFGGLFGLGGVATLALLIILLVHKELFRTMGGSYASRIQALDVIIGPLMLVLGFATIVRIASVL